jgi:hypothetical protein
MRAKVTLMARVNDGAKSFPFLGVQSVRNKIVIPVKS